MKRKTSVTISRSELSSTGVARSRNFWLTLVAMAGLSMILSGCGSKGPDLGAMLSKAEVATVSTPGALPDLDTTKSTALYTAEGTVDSIADALAAIEKPDERSDDKSGDVFLLYKSGTIWITNYKGIGGAAIVLYEDNNEAYSRHNTVLIANRGWGSRVNSYNSSSSSSNGFRGGGSSSGK